MLNDVFYITVYRGTMVCAPYLWLVNYMRRAGRLSIAKPVTSSRPAASKTGIRHPDHGDAPVAGKPAALETVALAQAAVGYSALVIQALFSNR